MDRPPSLNAVRYFSVAARLRSFTAAARELNVTQGAVSRMVQSLEHDLGVALFSRNGRFIALTPAGESYHASVSTALDAIAAASNAVRRSSSHDPLSLVVTTGFATRWLVSRLSEFASLHPDIQVNILGNDPEDTSYGPRAHMVIRYGSPPWRGGVATRLPLGTLGVVCAPELVSMAPLTGPADLVGRPLLSHTAGELDLWHEFFAHFGLDVPDMGQAPRFNQLLMLAEAAISGLGFALIPLFLYEAELRSGRLVRAIPQVTESSRGYYITHVRGAESDRKIRIFKAWLMHRARESQKSLSSGNE